MCVSSSEVTQRLLYNKSIKEYSIESFFIKNLKDSYSFIDDPFKNSERIGGTATFIENEIKEQL